MSGRRIKVSLRVLVCTLSLICIMAAVAHYDVSYRTKVATFVRKVESAGGVAVVKKRLICDGYPPIRYARPEVTHVYLSGDLEIAVLEGRSNLLRVRERYAGWIFEDLSVVSSVKVLRLNATDISDSDCERLSKLPDLQSLDLAATKLSGRGLRKLAESRSIRTLDVSFTCIGDEDVAVLSSMRSLTDVTIEGCAISDEAINQLCREGSRITVHRHR